jgi:hypothetical protein
MVGSIISSKLELWREAAIFNRVSLPKYVDMNWAINMKRSSSEVCVVFFRDQSVHSWLV